MKRILIALGLTAGLTVVAAVPASGATRNYDCSKPGNANKAACKTATKPTPKATASAPVTRTATTTTKATTTTRQYDCTKPGNANKAVCKTAAAQTPTGRSPGAVKTTTTSKATTTDCTKFYNKMRAVCRSSTATAAPHTTVAPAPKPSTTAAPAGGSKSPGVDNNPIGATAQCKDGTYSHAKTHQGACSRHGGVAKWM
jgi:hypothetical protein